MSMAGQSTPDRQSCRAGQARRALIASRRNWTDQNLRALRQRVENMGYVAAPMADGAVGESAGGTAMAEIIKAHEILLAPAAHDASARLGAAHIGTETAAENDAGCGLVASVLRAIGKALGPKRLWRSRVKSGEISGSGRGHAPLICLQSDMLYSIFFERQARIGPACGRKSSPHGVTAILPRSDGGHRRANYSPIECRRRGTTTLEIARALRAANARALVVSEGGALADALGGGCGTRYMPVASKIRL